MINSGKKGLYFLLQGFLIKEIGCTTLGALQGPEGYLLWLFAALGALCALQGAQKLYAPKVHVSFYVPTLGW